MLSHGQKWRQMKQQGGHAWEDSDAKAQGWMARAIWSLSIRVWMELADKQSFETCVLMCAVLCWMNPPPFLWSMFLQGCSILSDYKWKKETQLNLFWLKINWLGIGKLTVESLCCESITESEQDLCGLFSFWEQSFHPSSLKTHEAGVVRHSNTVHDHLSSRRWVMLQHSLFWQH